MTHLKPEKTSALGLCSGGLDSILAALVLRQQGIEVEWITFETPFFAADKARRASQMTGIPLTVRRITDTYLVMLKNPRCGYGQHMNPCMDCHALMFQSGRSDHDREENGSFDFLFRGEVLGQRPMSQNRHFPAVCGKTFGMDGYILRPLSAKRLDETLPEKKGLVDREQLLDITGRSRKPQIRLAKGFGLKSYPAPAGGCLLTDKGYSIRLKDLFDHQDEYTEGELELLKYGRHFRLNPSTKIIVGRTQADNESILKFHDPEKDTVLRMQKFAGPTVVMPGGGTREMLTLAGAICAGYSKAPGLTPVAVQVVAPRERFSLSVIALGASDVRHLMI